MGIFDKRLSFKPFEYPDCVKFGEAIQHSYWLHSEFNLISDISEFHSYLSEIEKEVIRRTMLAISQVEVSVKRFWMDIGKIFPKPEIMQVGAIFGECEVRHSNAYSFLLEKLGFNEDFLNLLHVPEFLNRVKHLTGHLYYEDSNSKEKSCLSLALFSLYVENVSLFSQFLIMKSFNKYKNLLKDIDNIIQATMVEEEVHANFGKWLLNTVKSEYPNIFDKDFFDKIYKHSQDAYEDERKLVDWIFEKGELEFLSKDIIHEFLKDRINNSLTSIGGEEIFKVDNDLLKEVSWFYEELLGKVHTDFFHKRPTNYSKRIHSVTAEDIF